MLKQGMTAAVLFALCVGLASCSYIMPNFNQKAKVASKQQLCTQLRQQIIFNNAPAGPNMTKTIPTQQAQVMKEYQHFNCDGSE